MARYGPKIRIKPSLPKFGGIAKMPKLLAKKRMLKDTGESFAKGMFKGLKRKSLTRQHKIVL